MVRTSTFDADAATSTEELLVTMSRRAAANTPLNERSDTRERILGVAVDMFARRGFEACTIKDLATAVGIKPPGIYSHFPSKEAILAEAMVRALNDFLVYMATPSTATNPRDELRETVQRHVLYQLEHLHVTRATDLLLNVETIGHLLPEADHQLLIAVQRFYYKRVREQVRLVLAERSALDLTTTTFAIITLCDRVTVWYHPDGRLTPRDLADQYWTLVRGMLGLV